MTDRGKYWRDVVRAWQRSGLSQAAFCRERDIKPVSFGWWKRKLVGAAGKKYERDRAAGKKRQGRGSTHRASEKKHISRKSASVAARFVEMPLDHPASTGQDLLRTVGQHVVPPNGYSTVPPVGYEVVLPGGATIRLPYDFDPERVTRLVLALQSSC